MAAVDEIAAIRNRVGINAAISIYSRNQDRGGVVIVHAAATAMTADAATVIIES